MRFTRITRIAVIVLVIAAAWQLGGGSSNPVTGEATIGTSKFRYRLDQTHTGRGDLRVVIPIHQTEVQGVVEWMPREGGVWASTPMSQEGSNLVGSVPHPQHGEVLVYRVRLTHIGTDVVIPDGEPVELRFR